MKKYDCLLPLLRVQAIDFNCHQYSLPLFIKSCSSQNSSFIKRLQLSVACWAGVNSSSSTGFSKTKTVWQTGRGNVQTAAQMCVTKNSIHKTSLYFIERWARELSHWFQFHFIFILQTNSLLLLPWIIKRCLCHFAFFHFSYHGGMCSVKYIKNLNHLYDCL